MSPINYIRRKSENLTTAIEQIYGLKVNNESDKSLKVASETFSSLLNIDLSKILEVDDESFVQEIIKLELSQECLQNLSDFMIVTSEIFLKINKPDESENLKRKTLKLLQHQEENAKTYSDRRIELINSLENELNQTKNNNNQ